MKGVLFLSHILDYRFISTQQIKNEVMSYGVKMVGAEYEWPETMGSGIKVGVIDTGVDINHSDLKNRIKSCVNFTGGKRYDVSDNSGHGTHVCGIIAAEKNGIGVVGVAPQCDLYVAKAFDDNGVGDAKAIISSLDWLIMQKVDIINMSFSSDYADADEKRAINRCLANGITLVAAAGNNGEGSRVSYPARYDGVIGVAAVDINKNVSDFSSCGEEIILAAAGTDILSTYKNNEYAILSGTSMAAPIISGAAAIIQAKSKKRFSRRLTPSEIEKVMGIYADNKIGNENNLCYGCGIFSFGRIK